MMVEVQSHGFQFEKWVRDAFFGGYSGDYTQEWDVPAERNVGGFPPELSGLPVSIKTARYGSPVGLGDAVRQRGIGVSFVMVAGFWEQRTPGEKWFEDIGVSGFTVEDWNGLWGAVSVESLKEIETEIKNPGLHYSEARELARRWKRKAAGSSASEIVINPKIDSKTQRRIQCSLPFKVFWRIAGRESRRADYPDLLGLKFPNPVASSPRKFNRS